MVAVLWVVSLLRPVVRVASSVLVMAMKSLWLLSKAVVVVAAVVVCFSLRLLCRSVLKCVVAAV